MSTSASACKHCGFIPIGEQALIACCPRCGSFPDDVQGSDTTWIQVDVDGVLVRKLENEICKHKLNVYCLEKELKKMSKEKIKRKMMEISFELINNDRNKLVHDLGECELALESKSQEGM